MHCTKYVNDLYCSAPLFYPSVNINGFATDSSLPFKVECLVVEAFWGRYCGAAKLNLIRGTGPTGFGEIVLRWLPLRRSWAARLTSIVACLLTVAALSMATANRGHAASYAAMVVDGHTGKILYSRQGDALRHPASLTKIMTLYLLFDLLEQGNFNENSLLSVSRYASRQAPSKLGLKPGQTIKVRDAIRVLVTKSANDVAVVVAENISGTEAKFAKLMTAKARKIGMSRTVFKNASGLPNSKQVTTARDMITLANNLMFDHPERYGYFKQKYFKYKGRKYRNHNRLLFDYKGTDGIKTGYTRASGFNLLANVRRGDKHLIAVVFGGKTSKRRNAAMRSILNKSLPRAVARLSKKQRPQSNNVQIASTLKFPVQAAAKAAKLPASNSQRTADPETVASIPKQKQSGQQGKDRGTFHIQVGAYARQSDALTRLSAIQQKAGDVVGRYAPVALPLAGAQRKLYRARFAGFTRNAAASTCTQLKRRAITCVVMSAD